VETVENLVVGEYAQLVFMVDEALVDGGDYRGEVNGIVAPVGKDGA
jgi:hypothetical protein